MRNIRFTALKILVALLTFSAVSHAEDIDIYSTNRNSTGTPNIMIVMDNASNSNAQMGPCTYWDGTAPGNHNDDKSLGNYMCALVDIAHTLKTNPDGSAVVNLGITDMHGVLLGLTPIDDKPYTGTYAGGVGLSNRNAFIKLVKLLDTVSGKVGQGPEFQEAWAYFTGGNAGTKGVDNSTGVLSGQKFSGTSGPGGECQANFIMFLSGVKANASHSLENGELAPLNTAVDNAVANSVIDSSMGTILKKEISPKTQFSWLLEWARFMRTVDSNTKADGVQSIRTYAVASGETAVPPAPITNDMERFIKDSTIYGGGKYFAAGTSKTAVVNSILSILNEVQAVNSVFASSSLPVSVNTQGTYLNQIYMGMFRPDIGGSPRWLGNLKQYQFIKDPTTGVIQLGDNTTPNPKAAISSANTGFISADAISFWTKQDLTVEPDLGGGFWRNQPNGAGGGYDLKDGEVVEKGGAAQQMRLTWLNSQTARKLYTYCPSGASCNANLTDASNAFTAANAGISTTAFGTAGTLSITSIIRNGTTATVTTSGSHGFNTGDLVTISGVDQPEYNGQQTVTVTGASTFTIAGLADYPNTPSTGAKNAETVTVNVTAHGFSNGNSVTISGASPSDYNGNWTIAGVTANAFTFSIPITPNAPAVNSYKIQMQQYSVNVSKLQKSGGNSKATTVAAHGLRAGQKFTIAGTTNYNGTYTVSSVTDALNFLFSGPNGNIADETTGTISTDNTLYALTGVTRVMTTVAGTASAVDSSGVFANGDKVNISYSAGAATNEAAYVASGVTISCTNTGSPGVCSSGNFTYPITISPAVSASGASMQVGLAPSGAQTSTIAVGNITRSGATATATGITANLLSNGSVVDIVTSGSAVNTESAYLGSWTVTCTAPCTSFTFGPVALTPTSPATGTNKTAFNPASPPDKTSLVNWIRGLDNFGDEQGPGSAVANVRPSLHADVLHSRPVVINYGGNTNKIVVYYGTNDGVFHAVNANQTGAIGTVNPGNEMWGLIPTEFYGKLNRQRSGIPVLKLPSTPSGIQPAPQPKDYFVDGPTGVYQTVKADGSADKVYLYLTMRRGGNFIYALDVSDPLTPKYLWKIDNSIAGFEELGQTWSRPRVALVKGHNGPVLIFGAGYDYAEDTEPPTTNTQGRGIFVVDAVTGALVWSASPTGTASATHAVVPAMTSSIPSDVTMIDRDHDGYVERLYVGDTGGNVWRVDLEPTAGYTTGNWQVLKLAALGCDAGVCASGTTPRKFMFPPSVVSIGIDGASGSYDAVLLGSGDREHPLYSAATNSAYLTTNQFYMLKDTQTTKDGSGLTTLIQSSLVDTTSTNAYNGTKSGFFFTFGTGEKSVNAAVTTGGTTFFGTNQPNAPGVATCGNDLGVARAYAVDFVTGVQSSVTLDGGGLPPSPTAGLVTIGTPSQANPPVSFCIGCVTPPKKGGPSCDSAIENCYQDKAGAMHVKRTYWYKN